MKHLSSSAAETNLIASWVIHQLVCAGMERLTSVHRVQDHFVPNHHLRSHTKHAEQGEKRDTTTPTPCSTTLYAAATAKDKGGFQQIAALVVATCPPSRTCTPPSI